MQASMNRWTALVATGPLVLVMNAASIGFMIAEAPGGYEVFLAAAAMSLISWPLVLVGIWKDAGVVERETGVEYATWLWLLFAVFVSPLTATAYLISRRRTYSVTSKGGSPAA